MNENKQTTTTLAGSQCIPCTEGAEPLKRQVIRELYKQLSPGWRLIDEHHIEKDFKFGDFKEALEFVNKISQLADSQSHHPNVYLAWGKVKLTLWTHKIHGLHENDFILAAKIDEL